VVYAKPPFAGPAVFLKYISRYVHRVAIADRRIVAYDGRMVTFEYRDRADGNAVKQMTLTATSFLRRFLLHLLPKGFVKIRSFGLLANRVKERNLLRCRELLGPSPSKAPAEDDLTGAADSADSGQDAPSANTCPHCSTRLVRQGELPPTRSTSPPRSPCEPSPA
jgi:hypothetical protein